MKLLDLSMHGFSFFYLFVLYNAGRALAVFVHSEGATPAVDHSTTYMWLLFPLFILRCQVRLDWCGTYDRLHVLLAVMYM